MFQAHLLSPAYIFPISAKNKKRSNIAFYSPLTSLLFISFVTLRLKMPKNNNSYFISLSDDHVSFYFAHFFTLMEKSRMCIYFYEPGKNGKYVCSEKKLLFPFYKSFYYSEVLYFVWKERKYKCLEFHIRHIPFVYSFFFVLTMI